MKPHDASPEERLAEAYADAPDCPAPEVFLGASWNDLSDEERAGFDEHALRCPACASERELARNFDESLAAEELSSDEVDWVVNKLTERAPVTRRRVSLSWGLAAAAVVVLGMAAGLLAFRTPGPVLPDPGSAPPVMRSASIRAIQPVGDSLDIPEKFDWEEVGRAENYRVRVMGVDGTILWEKTVRHPTVDLPERLRDTLHRAVRYRWSVEAFDAEDAPLAGSGPVEFLVVIEADGR
jgi:hypothetical protein